LQFITYCETFFVVMTVLAYKNSMLYVNTSLSQYNSIKLMD
jgi:hypothetical protein